MTRRRPSRLPTNRYTRGLVSYLDVVYAQTALFANQRVLTQISGQRMVATLVLFKAIGGWLQAPSGASGSSATKDTVREHP